MGEKIELDKDILNKLFEAAGMSVPDNITESEISKISEKIQKNNGKKSGSSSSSESSTGSNTNNKDYLQCGDDIARPGTVLVVDDLGVIVYQLELLFKKIGFEVTTANKVNDCISKFKKKDFDYVIMDLFLPTEKEGFLLLDELKKLVLLCKLDTKIVVMTASAKTDYKVACKNRGADFFLEKTQGWQNELINYCK